MAANFKPDDRVFAKINGWPLWPAKVLKPVQEKGEAYEIRFYGTYDTSTAKPDKMFVYNGENKAKYGKPKLFRRWKEAMDEIENNILIGETGPFEAEKAPKPPKPPACRESKISLSNRDPISSISSATKGFTPSAPSTPSGTDLVSRSGRTIKPKRFADDEISTPIATKNKNLCQSECSEGPSNKRAKRCGKTLPAASKSSSIWQPRKPTPRPRMVIGKRKRTSPPKAYQSSGSILPDISSVVPVPKAPGLKPAEVPCKFEAPLPQLQAGKKSLPALIPAAASVKAVQQLYKTADLSSVRRATSLRLQARKRVTDEEPEKNGPSVPATGVNKANADDKGNLKDGEQSSNRSESSNRSDIESESEMEKNSEIDETSSRYSEANDESLKRLEFQDKDCKLFDLRQKTKDALKTKQDSNGDEFNPENAMDQERRANQIRTLRIEGEIYEIIRGIVSFLPERQAGLDVARAYAFLESLGTYKLTALILKKHPQIVRTVARLRNYVGNVEQWDVTKEQVLEFKKSATMIRQKASDICSSFYNVLIAPDEKDPTLPFEEIYEEKMEHFKLQTQDLTLNEIIGLTAELKNGGFEMIDVGEIE